MMTEQSTPSGIDPNSVRKVVNVQASQAVAWRVFTEKMGTWWPLATYKIGKANAVDAVIERVLSAKLRNRKIAFPARCDSPSVMRNRREERFVPRFRGSSTASTPRA